MDSKKPEMSEQQIDAILDVLGTEKAEGMLSEIMQAEAAPQDPTARSAKEIRARVKELAASRPELIVKIIEYWIKEDRRKR